MTSHRPKSSADTKTVREREMPDHDRLKIAFISATSGFTLGTAAHLLRRPELADGAGLWLYAPPTEESDLRLMASAIAMMAKDQGRALEVRATTDRREALDGAHYVVTALRAGRLEAHRIDIELPKDYGIYQIVGDTINPGGIFAGLRNYAVIGSIAEDMKRYSRAGAHILNMSNPEGSICRMVHEGTGVPVVGLCPGIYGLKRFLARVLAVEEQRLVVEIAGFNHLTWVTRLELDGADAYPMLRQAYADKGPWPAVASCLLKELASSHLAADRHVAESSPFLRMTRDRGALTAWYCGRDAMILRSEAVELQSDRARPLTELDQHGRRVAGRNIDRLRRPTLGRPATTCIGPTAGRSASGTTEAPCGGTGHHCVAEAPQRVGALPERVTRSFAHSSSAAPQSVLSKVTAGDRAAAASWNSILRAPARRLRSRPGCSPPMPCTCDVS